MTLLRCAAAAIRYAAAAVALVIVIVISAIYGMVWGDVNANPNRPFR